MATMATLMMSAAVPWMGGIHGIAFGIAADGGIARIDVGQVATALEFREDVTPFLGAIDARVHIFLDLRVGFEIAVDQLFGFPTGDAEPFRESEGRDAVDDAEIGRFGLAALVARDLFDGVCGRCARRWRRGCRGRR